MSIASLILDLIKEYILICKDIIGYFLIKIPTKWQVGTKHVILLHGFNESWYSFKSVGNFLNNLGYKVHTVDYNTHGSIEKCAESAEKYIKVNGIQEVVLIGHSKGGLIARYLLSMTSSFVIKKIIIIATPNKGTLFGYLGFGNLMQLQPNSNFLSALNTNDSRNIYNFYPKVDNHVIPNTNLLLDGSHNMQIDIIGHTRILESKELLKKINLLLAKNESTSRDSRS